MPTSSAPVLISVVGVLIVNLIRTSSVVPIVNLLPNTSVSLTLNLFGSPNFGSKWMPLITVPSGSVKSAHTDLASVTPSTVTSKYAYSYCDKALLMAYGVAVTVSPLTDKLNPKILIFAILYLL